MTASSGVTSELVAQSVSQFSDLRTLKSSYYRLEGDSEPQGTFLEIDSSQELATRLTSCSSEVVVSQYLGAVDVYQFYDVDASLPYCVPKAQAVKLLECKLLSPLTRVRAKYLYGSLFFFICLDEGVSRLFKSRNAWVAYNTMTQECWGVGVGTFTFPNAFFFASKYDGLETTISKLLSSKAASKITCLHLLTEEVEQLMDIPL